MRLRPASFLRHYWQRKPRLLRGVLSDFRDPLTPEQFLQLACRPDVESRLVLETGGRHPWQVVPGPQNLRRLHRLPSTRWTLLLQEANRHVPALADLLERFAFIPHWRVNDVMVSLAPRRGTVGPHVDGYDVFLIQGHGRRRWQIATRFDPRTRPGLDLRILRRFRPQQEWVLEPGDVLYLPPGVAHFGVALEECFTYSVGFRAPSHAELVQGALLRLVNAMDRRSLYRDPGLPWQRNPGEIAGTAVARIRRMVEAECARLAGPLFDRVVGEMLTEAKTAQLPPRPVGPESVRRRLRAGAGLRRSESSRIAFIRRPGRLDLFVDGRHHPLPRRLAFAGPLLSGRRRLPAPLLLSRLRAPGFVELLAELVSAGAFALEPSRGRRKSSG